MKIIKNFKVIITFFCIYKSEFGDLEYIKIIFKFGNFQTLELFQKKFKLSALNFLASKILIAPEKIIIKLKYLQI